MHNFGRRLLPWQVGSLKDSLRFHLLPSYDSGARTREVTGCDLPGQIHTRIYGYFLGRVNAQMGTCHSRIMRESYVSGRVTATDISGDNTDPMRRSAHGNKTQTVDGGETGRIDDQVPAQGESGTASTDTLGTFSLKNGR
jgi:hypothetical protein